MRRRLLEPDEYKALSKATKAKLYELLGEYVNRRPTIIPGRAMTPAEKQARYRDRKRAAAERGEA